MTRRATKNKERVFAEAAAKGLGEIWNLEEISEPLDFIVRRPDHPPFGLEITQLHDSPLDSGGSSLMEAQGKRRYQLNEIIKRYYDSGGRPLRVNFLGSLSDSKLIANHLLCMSSILNVEEVTVELENTKMWILPLPKDDPRFARYAIWHVADASFVRQIPRALVEQQIAQKAARLEAYREKSTDIDLLLAIDRTTHAGRFTVPHEQPFQTMGFRRVILLSYPLEVHIIS